MHRCGDIKDDVNKIQDCNYELRREVDGSGTALSTPSSSSDFMTGEADDSSDSRSIIPFSLRSVETILSLSKEVSEEDLKEMVEKCKEMVLESAECSNERKWLVRRLIELRLRVQELRETSEPNLLETQVTLGHHLVPQKYLITVPRPVYCDHCSGAIWTMLQSWYMCNDCKFCCHWKCLNSICRVCVHVVASEAGGYTYTKDICPEQGLSNQGYRCAECKVKITFIPDLSLVKRIREEMQMMKHYLVLCPEASNQGLPWKIGIRTHLIENSENYSIKDILDLNNGTLQEEIRAVYDTMHAHITEQCQLCKARGHLCELCGNDEIIYPWDTNSVSCHQCTAVYHRMCWSKRNHCCPRCARLQKRRAIQDEQTPDTDDCVTEDGWNTSQSLSDET
ncbi:differentially expressed in FDCP 8 homolog isoform X4 [Ptiloglossa arizonensis]|uniref:differentially expressed in FDCP 8 homolog isoform X4 n=1 Tax=Ptiloglossa arizonensis TaxID=3350558 RepID=UPI003FA01A92